MARKLTMKQDRFVEEYLVDLNATQAAIRAGYKHPDNGRQLLTKTHVLEAIEAAKAERSTRTEVTMDRVVLELARIAFMDPRRVFKWGPNGITLIDSDTLTDDEAATIAEVSETITENGGSIRGKRYDKLKALELLGRHLGGFVERHELTGKDVGPIQTEQKPDFSNYSTEDLKVLRDIVERNTKPQPGAS